MLKKIKYYSFVDILAYCNSYPYSDCPINGKTPVSGWFKTLIGDYDMAYSIKGLNSSLTSTIIDAIVDILMASVWNRHWEDYIYSVRMGFEDSHDLTNEDVGRVLNKIINLLDNTAPRYIPMFKANESATDDLVKKASSNSSSSTRFNDTPQNTGGYEDLDHATTTTHFESSASADTGSIVDRLSAMYANFKNVILEWSNEFNCLFLNEAQIEWRDYYEN